MDKSDVQQSVLSDLNSLFSFRELNGHCVVSTPFRYPDGGFVAVCCKAEGDSILITDEAETFGWLSSQGGPMVPTPQQLQIIENICRPLRVEYDDCELRAHCHQGDSLTDAITRVAQAVVRVADISHTSDFMDYESPADSVGKG